MILGAILIKIRFPTGDQKVTIDDSDDGYFEDSSISSIDENVDVHDKRDIQLKSSLKNE